jgi:apolipoprotein N-acyltransferase
MTLPALVIPAFGILVSVTWNSRRSFSSGFAFGVGYFGSSLYWIAESFKCVGLGDYGYIAVAALVLYLSIYPAVVCLLSLKIAKTRIQFMLLFVVFWTLSEYARGIVFTGFPWNLVGYATYKIPYFPQIADLLSIYGVSFLYLLICIFLLYRKTIIASTCIFATVLLYGYLRINYGNFTETLNNEYVVRIVQPSISQEDKMDPKKFKENLNKHLSISDLNNPSPSRKRLIIWPEAAINAPITKQNGILEYIGSFLTDKNTYLITGCDIIDNKNNIYNGACVIGNNGKVLQTYSKRHLLPFGEFIPEFLLELGLKKVTPGITNFSRGNSTRTVQIEGVDKFDMVICFEIVFPWEICDDNSSTWILNLTNDTWFGNSDGPTQHLVTTCFRAIEERKPIVRVANNGISCLIDRYGKVLQKLDANVIGYIDVIP